MLDIVKLNLTRNEIAIYQLIEKSCNFTYSLTEIAKMINLSRQTVVKSLQSLVAHKLIIKIDFFVGKVRRCKYKLVNNIRNGLNGQSNWTSPAVGVGSRPNKGKGEVARSSNITKIINKINNKIIKKNNNINNINQENTLPLSSCQDKDYKNFSFFAKRKTHIGETSYKLWDKTHNLGVLSRYRYFSVCKYVLTNLLRESNRDLLDFFNTKSSHDVCCLLEHVLVRFEKYVYNVAKSVGGYFRQMLLAAIATYDADRENCYGGVATCEGIKEAKMEEVWLLDGGW